jgi:hypothetical protein
MSSKEYITNNKTKQMSKLISTMESVNNWQYTDVANTKRYGIKTITLWQSVITKFRTAVKNGYKLNKKQINYLASVMEERGYTNTSIASIDLYSAALTKRKWLSLLKKEKSLQYDVKQFRKQYGLK